MRRRNVGAASGDEEPSGTARALNSLRHFDVYKKVHEDYLRKSQSGGIVTVITAIIVVVLFWHEAVEFWSTEIRDSIVVDTRINEKLAIGLNVTFPHLRCEEISVDSVDSVGDHQIGVHGGINTMPLTVDGQLAEEFQAKPDDCFSCYEGHDEQHKCCNTCADLKEAYEANDLVATKQIMDALPQCQNSVGCRVAGKVIVNRVSGNVHVALGRSKIRHGSHVHEFSTDEIRDGYNTTHRIESITFGDHVPGLFSSLDGTMKVVKHGSYMFHYYIKLVPTVFRSRYGDEQYTNQYSVRDAAHNVILSNGVVTGLPGVFIVYDFSPFLVRKTECVHPWSYMFTSMCALIGGVCTVAGVVETFIAAMTAPCTPTENAKK